MDPRNWLDRETWIFLLGIAVGGALVLAGVVVSGLL
jgi:hypothetical protein